MYPVILTLHHPLSYPLPYPPLIHVHYYTFSPFLCIIYNRSHSPSRDSEKENSLFRISDRVEVEQSRGKYLPGTVTKLRLDGTFDVELDNGDVARQVDMERLRKLSKRRRHDDDDEDESKSPSRRRKESSRKRDHEDGKDEDDPKYPTEPVFRSGKYTHMSSCPYFFIISR